MKHRIIITPELVFTAIHSYLASRGHTNIKRELEGGVLTFVTEHSARQSFNESIPATCAWPFDCFIQCGGDGVVIGRGKGDSYRTAFWEAFPRNPDTFLRGEGATIEEAERNCFAKYQRITACAGHEFERGKYENGAGTCKHCGLFMSGVFEPTEKWKQQSAASLARIEAKLATEEPSAE